MHPRFLYWCFNVPESRKATLGDGSMTDVTEANCVLEVFNAEQRARDAEVLSAATMFVWRKQHRGHVSLCPRKSIIREQYNHNPASFVPQMAPAAPSVHITAAAAQEELMQAEAHAAHAAHAAAAAAEVEMDPSAAAIAAAVVSAFETQEQHAANRKRGQMHCGFRFPDGRTCDGSGSTLTGRAVHTRRDQCPHLYIAMQQQQLLSSAIPLNLAATMMLQQQLPLAGLMQAQGFAPGQLLVNAQTGQLLVAAPLGAMPHQHQHPQ